MDRTSRQKLCLKRWLESGGRSSIVACTGFGIRNKKYKLYNFFKNGSRSIQEWTELLLTKNGEVCDDNTVVTEKPKEFSAPYSVEIEPDLSE